jgi:hypothetical protein
LIVLISAAAGGVYYFFIYLPKLTPPLPPIADTDVPKESAKDVVLDTEIGLVNGGKRS